MPKKLDKLDKSLLSFPVLFQKINEYSTADERFTKVKIFLMHLGKNENGTIFEKETVDEAIETLEYCPIVGFLESNCAGEDDFSDHRYIITKTENGVCRKYMGVAYGVLLSSADNNAHYEDRLCDDGITRTFLVVEGLLWRMFEDSTEIMDRDIIKSHSMELWQNEDSFDGYVDDDGNFVFTKFSFRAACILGNDYEPAMIGSTIEVQFTVNDFVKQIQSELNNKYTAFTKLVDKNDKQGGSEVMQKTDFTQTVMEQFSDISNIVKDHESVKNRWGEAIPRYMLADIQDNEVIVVDAKNNYSYYGCEFHVEGDKPIINFETAKRKKISYADYVEEETVNENAFDFGKYIEEVEETAYSKVVSAEEKLAKAESDKETAESNYASIKSDYDEIKPMYESYVKAEQERIEAETNAQKDALFAQYENVLKDNDEFIKLKEAKADYSVDEIEAKCAIMYARANIQSINYNKQKTISPAVGIPCADDGENDGYVNTEKYGRIYVGDK